MLNIALSKLKQSGQQYMQQIKPDPAENTLTGKIKQNWKIAILCTLPIVFLVYPRPFLYLMRPIINRVSKSYNSSCPKLSKIILATNKGFSAQKAIKNNMHAGSAQNIIVINLFSTVDVSRSSVDGGAQRFSRSISWNQAFSQDSSLQIKADNAALKIKLVMIEAAKERQEDYSIIVKGLPELLRVVQAKIYQMQPDEYYKIPMFTSDDQVHVLETGTDSKSYQHKVEKVKY